MVEHRGDPAGCAQELGAALSQPELEELEGPAAPATARACRAALRLAVALGYCRLFAVPLEDDLAGVLPPRAALAAATALHQDLTALQADAERLGAEPDGEGEGEEALEARMDAWAAFVAIDEAWEDCLAAAPLRADPLEDQLSKAIDLLVEAGQDLDARLRGKVDVLAGATETNLLDNWRGLLGEAYREPLPWWLDGTLEAAHRATLEKALASLPGPAVWRQRVARPRRRGYPARVLPPVVRAAAEERSEAPPIGTTLRWSSPDGVWTALLDLPPSSTPEVEKARFPLEFHSDRADPARLADTPVLLGGVPSQVDTNGLAYFTLAALRAAAELSLQVGEGEEWEAQPGNTGTDIG